MAETAKKPHGLFRVIHELQPDAMRLDPYPFFQEMRRQSPVRFDPARQCWDVFRYEDVQRIYQDAEGFSSLHPADREGLPGLSILTQDPPTHTRLRGLVSKAFVPKAIQRLAPRIASVTDELIDTVIDQGRCDLAQSIAIPLPIHVIAELIGVPVEDQTLFKKWVQTIFAEFKADESGEAAAKLMAEKEQTQQQLAGYYFNLIAERRKAPKQDLISTLLQADDHGDTLTEHELLEFCILLLVAGFETSACLITNAVRCFLDDADAREQILQNPRLIPSAIEEVLRYRSPMLTNVRHATRDVTIGGQSIQKGDQLVLWIASANRDEQVFDHADQFRIDRSPNHHLAFGGGVHFCLGSSLARLEAQLAVPAIFKRLKNLRCIDNALLKPVSNPITCGLSEFPVQFDI